MKIKVIGFGGIVLGLLLWACWSFAYQRGYSQGARDEFACWKQEPTTAEAMVYVGKRDFWTYPGGKKAPPPAPRPRFRGMNVNNIPSMSFP